MTKCEGKAGVIDLKGLLARDEDFVRAAVEATGAGGARGRDDRGDRRREGGAHRDAAIVSQWLLRALADHSGWDPGIARCRGIG